MQEPDSCLGKPVTGLQTMLRTVAARESALPNVIPDGIYGAETMRCVQAFQNSRGLPATGIADYTTWTALCAAFEAALVELSPAEPLWIALPPEGKLRKGHEGPCVLLLQAMLHALAAQFANLPSCAVSGLYTDQTVASVLALQAACDLQQTGEVDKSLWRLLTGLFAQLPACAAS